jgi:hypothetical protein
MQMSGTTEPQPKVAALSKVPEVATDLPAETEEPVELDAITLTSSDLTASATVLTDGPQITSDVVLWAPMAPVVAMEPVLASLDTDKVPQPVEPAPETVSQTDDCVIDLTGETRAAAMVALSLSAPCQPNARVTFKHEGMTFTAFTDADGGFEVEVPALSEAATFFAILEDGNGAAIEIEVDTLGFYDRSVVQWQGRSGVELHALEYGAAWEDDGHVWSGAPREAAVAARGEGGFLTRLGDETLTDGRMVEVYTFPTATARVEGDVSLSVEIEVTEANCGRELRADVIEVTDAIIGQKGELSLSVPDCDAIGGYIQLKNLVRDLKIAAR